MEEHKDSVPNRRKSPTDPPNRTGSVTDDSSWKDASLSARSSTIQDTDPEDIGSGSDFEEEGEETDPEEMESEGEIENASRVTQISEARSSTIRDPDLEKGASAHGTLKSRHGSHVQFERPPPDYESEIFEEEQEGEEEPDFQGRRESVTERKRRFSFFQSTCFRDGIRPIDIVLTYEVQNAKEDKKGGKRLKKETFKAECRQKFEAALIEQGFELENEDPRNSVTGKIGFVKIHAPYAVLERQAELRSLQKPFMQADIEQPKTSSWKKLSQKFCGKDPFSLQENYQRPHKEYFTDVFDRDRKKDFLNYDDELAFFSVTQRILLTWDSITSTLIKLSEDQDDPKKGDRDPKKSSKAEEKSMSANGQEKAINGKDQKKSAQNGAIKEKSMETKLDIDSIDRNRDDQSIDFDRTIRHKAKKRDQAASDQGDIDIEEGDRAEEEADDEEEEEPAENEIEEPVPSEEKLSDDIDEDEAMTDGKSVSFHFLLQMGVYKSGYPLHDSNIEDDPELAMQSIEDWPLRKYLYESWGRPRQWRRYQPIQAVREYYGEKVGLYFAWIGFYTKMLIIPSIVGILVFIYGVLSVPFNDFSYTICKDDEVANMTLCPDCPTEACPYTKLRSYCNMSRLAAAFDNNLTVFFAIFMAIWAVCFLEFWKRYRSKLCVDWDVTDEEFEGETVRPEYALRAPDQKLNPVTMQMEPHLRTATRLKRILASLATVLFFIVVVVGLLAGVMVYKVVGPTWWKLWLSRGDEVDSSKERSEYGLIVSITSSVANGIFIAIMTKLYMMVAWYLTQAEFPRTDREFEHSYTYKVFVFQCVNFYGALFYLAIIRGRVSVPPHEQNYETRCPISGCIVDVSIQLAVVFVGKQTINNIIELGLPMFKAFMKRCRRKKAQKGGDFERPLPTWERDFYLEDPGKILLFGDYLELLIQYGFTTMFVAAFPLAPLFAFLNNIIEIRLDAYKNLVFTQRPIPLRAKNIGPWYKLLVIVTRIAVITNALVIAFTTQFIDRIMFKFVEGNEWIATHHLNRPKENLLFFTLSEFNVSDAYLGGPKYTEHLYGPIVETNGDINTTHVEQCYYVDYRHAHSDPTTPYARSNIWWHVLAARLVFVVLFEHFVFLFQSTLSSLIPDVSDRDQMRTAREQYLIKANFLQREFGQERRRNAGGYADDSDEEAEFVPDELPDWLVSGRSPPVSTIEGTASRMRRGGRSVHSETSTQRTVGSRGKVLVPGRQNRPFLMMAIRKLMRLD